MSKLLFLTMIMTFQALCSEPERRNSFLNQDQDRHTQEEVLCIQQQKTPQEQLMLMHQQYKKNISDVREELEQQKKRYRLLKIN
ncbi:hypothetical protein [Candidatus Odyssella acanthamoebae]|uniref:Uncharacterized protein n=1 Tax=Candidatus Odyssella acanthamoebae TaxID=91604 RepID=A0A077B0L3_9PROT|nr:hypothetical protein [Candidatus Paracaedibacter acanthamoebae]AIK96460.1 hypothetical protein ID47_06450 [Candidatus Paracaedibacter acanthamoebae]